MEYQKYSKIIACCSNVAYAIWSTKDLAYLEGHKHNYDGGYINDKENIDALRNSALKKLRDNKKIVNEAIIAVEQQAPNYCHFLTNILPQVVKMWKEIKAEHIILSDITSYAREFIALLGINANLISIRNKSIYANTALARYRYPNKDKTYVEHKELAAISNIFDEYKIKKQGTPDKIFIERKESNNGSLARRIEPIKQTHQLIREKGYEIIYLEDLDIKSKIELFYNAKKIVTVHGAGLGNIIFCNQQCEIIEARNSLGMPRIFIELASELGLKNYTTIELESYLNEKDAEELKRKSGNKSNNILPIRLNKEFERLL